MTLFKKICCFSLASASVGGGVAVVKYLTSSSNAFPSGDFNELDLQKSSVKEKIKKDHDSALKFCKSTCNREKRKQILDANKDLEFDFRFI